MTSKKHCKGHFCIESGRKKSKTMNKRKKSKTMSNKYRKNIKKGGNGKYTVNCCVCGNNENIIDTLAPSACKIKHGLRAHRICQECWWNPKTGFGKEDSSHKCPGCEKGLPLTNIKLPEPILMDLTEDD